MKNSDKTIIKSIEKIPTRRETIYLCLAVRDAYLGFDREDYCQSGIERCGGCFGCIQYQNLQRSYKIIKKYIPKICDKKNCYNRERGKF